jgi:hypothetical protein
MIQHFYLGSRFLGSQEISCWIDDCRNPVRLNPHSSAFCCPHCGELWGRVVVEGAAFWCFHHRHCRRCATYDGSPAQSQAGSFLDPPHWRASPLLLHPSTPDAVVEWEFQGILPIIEKELQHAENSLAAA